MNQTKEEEKSKKEFQDLQKPHKIKHMPPKVEEMNKEAQIKSIEFIIQNNRIGIISKSLKLAQNRFLNKMFLYEYLNVQGQNILAEYVYDPKLAKMKKPNAHSASDWSQTELDYYCIDFDYKSLDQMFGSEIHDSKLDDDVQFFLKKHEGAFFYKYRTDFWYNPNRQIKDYDNYCSLLCTYESYSTNEANVNQIIGYLLNLNFEKEFVVVPEFSLALWVDKQQKEAKPDFSLAEILKEKIQGFLVVVENKTDENFKSFARLMAAGIAVAQQPEWKKERSVYMILCQGLALTFFKAQFSETILENVNEGNDSAEKFNVKRMNRTLNLSYADDLLMIAEIFSVIKKELIKEIKN